MKTKLNNKNKVTAVKVKIAKNNKNKKVTNKVARAASSVSTGAGRPRQDLAWPKRKYFTIADVEKLNAVSTLTIRNRIKEGMSKNAIKRGDNIPGEGRAHPQYSYQLTGKRFN